jgi:hypothetical protein
MKKAINIIVAATCFLIHPLTACGGKSIPGTFVLSIEGKITNAPKTGAFTRIELLSDNRVIDSFILRDQQRTFCFNLNLNNNYTMRVSRVGYVSKLICIDTRVPFFDDNFYRFAFETKLIDQRASEKLNRHLLDMPIAMIYFDGKKGCFYYSKEYTNNIKRELAMK